MAVTRLSNAFIHDVYGTYFSVNDPETTLFYQSGVIQRTDVLATNASRLLFRSGKIWTLPANRIIPMMILRT